MLAYVFSHRPAEGIDVAAYETSLRRFHEELARASLAGFIESATVAIGGGYSDWYLLESSSAMDVLNAAAISGARAASHDSVARVATDGVGKLFNLASGRPSTIERFEVRFGKPAGTSYSDLYASLEPWAGRPGVSLWRRMMVLGPPPEFCMTTPEPIELPAEMHAEVLPRKPI